MATNWLTSGKVAELQEKQACNEVNAKVEQYYYTLLIYEKKAYS